MGSTTSENGARKFTLLKVISGIYTKTTGSIKIDGVEVSIKSASDAKHLGIAMIPQEFNLISSLNVFENTFLGNEIKKDFLLNKSVMRDRANVLLKELKTSLSPDSLIENLSVTEKQMVDIAKALVNDSRILIMDEPTTVLTDHEVDIFFFLGRQT
jgi:ribose transport system ATP-binding protein